MGTRAVDPRSESISEYYDDDSAKPHSKGLVSGVREDSPSFVVRTGGLHSHQPNIITRSARKEENRRVVTRSV